MFVLPTSQQEEYMACSHCLQKFSTGRTSLTKIE